jgi:hypothetical protein
MLAFLKGLRFCEKGTSACQVTPEACPEKLKAGPEETEAAVKWQELHNGGVKVDAIRSLED